MKFKKMMALVFSASLIISSIGVSAETNPAGDQNSDNTNIASADMPFEDVSESNQEIYASVAYVWRNDLMDGVSDREFKPDDYLTRAMYVTVLGRTAEIDTSEYEGTNYSDVKDGQWYTPYIEWAHENEITYGIGDHLFGVNEIVTREQIATFIARYLEAEGYELDDETEPLEEMYEDASNIQDWAADSVALMNEYGIMQGDEDGYFRPQAGVTRAEAAMIFTRLNSVVNDNICVYIGKTGNDVVSDFGDDYELITDDGVTGLVYDHISFILSENSLDGSVTGIAVSDNTEIGYGLNPQMTLPELKETCAEIGVSIGEPVTNDEGPDLECTLTFEYENNEFTYSWSPLEDPEVTKSYGVSICGIDVSEEQAKQLAIQISQSLPNNKYGSIEEKDVEIKNQSDAGYIIFVPVVFDDETGHVDVIWIRKTPGESKYIESVQDDIHEYDPSTGEIINN